MYHGITNNVLFQFLCCRYKFSAKVYKYITDIFRQQTEAVSDKYYQCYTIIIVVCYCRLIRLYKLRYNYTHTFSRDNDIKLFFGDTG